MRVSRRWRPRYPRRRHILHQTWPLGCDGGAISSQILYCSLPAGGKFTLDSWLLPRREARVVAEAHVGGRATSKLLLEVLIGLWVRCSAQILLILIEMRVRRRTRSAEGRRRCMIPFSYVWRGRLPSLFLVNHQLRVCWPVEKSLEMHRVIKVLLGLDHLIEAEVVMPLFQGVEGNVSIVLAQWMLCRMHIHF